MRVEGKCVENIAREKETKTKKKKKKRVKKQTAEGEVGVQPMQFPWYHILAPLSLTVVTYKYSRPNLATSVAMAVLLVAAALYS